MRAAINNMNIAQASSPASSGGLPPPGLNAAKNRGETPLASTAGTAALPGYPDYVCRVTTEKLRTICASPGEARKAEGQRLTGGFLRSLRPGSPRNPERFDGEIRHRRRTPVHAAQRTESLADFTTRQRERNHRHIRGPRLTPQRREPTAVAALCGLTNGNVKPRNTRIFLSSTKLDLE
jgi:hypothetical protein